MNRVAFLSVFMLLALAGCDESMLVYSSGFSFSKYEYVIMGRPDGPSSSATLYGMDIELANVLSRHNMKIIGGKEYESMSADDKSKTLLARLAVEATKKHVVLTVSFDDMVTGRTGASITTEAKGDVLKLKSRTKAFDHAADEIVAAFQQDQGLKISESQRH